MGKDDWSSNSLLQPVSAIKRNRRPLFLPMEIGPDIGSPQAASLASEPPLDVAQPSVIRPAVAADCGRMATPIIRATDQGAANAGRSHFGEGDFLRALHLGRICESLGGLLGAVTLDECDQTVRKFLVLKVATLIGVGKLISCRSLCNETKPSCPNQSLALRRRPACRTPDT
jgi:hypothetical protein